MEIVHSQENNSALIGFERDGLCMRINSFNYSGHESQAVLIPDFLLGRDGRVTFWRK